MFARFSCVREVSSTRALFRGLGAVRGLTRDAYPRTLPECSRAVRNRGRRVWPQLRRVATRTEPSLTCREENDAALAIATAKLGEHVNIGRKRVRALSGHCGRVQVQ